MGNKNILSQTVAIKKIESKLGKIDQDLQKLSDEKLVEIHSSVVLSQKEIVNLQTNVEKFDKNIQKIESKVKTNFDEKVSVLNETLHLLQDDSRSKIKQIDSKLDSKMADIDRNLIELKSIESKVLANFDEKVSVLNETLHQLEDDSKSRMEQIDSKVESKMSEFGRSLIELKSMSQTSDIKQIQTKITAIDQNINRLDSTFEHIVEKTINGKSNCLDGWTFFEHTSKCYKCFDKKLSWQQSQLYCQNLVDARNSNLASVYDEETNIFLKNLTERTSYIGGYYKDGWLWTDGTIWNTDKWTNSPFYPGKILKCNICPVINHS